MDLIDAIVTAIPFAAGAWAAWYLPRWAGEGYRRPSGPETEDWSAGDLPSRPYRDLTRV
jgi:hypothetical protein